MAETPALVVKTWFWFLDPKSVNFQHFRRRKKAPYSTASYFFCIWVTIVPHKKHYFVRFCFFTKNGVFIFRNSKKKGWPDIIICPKVSKKVNIFEIVSLEVYDRGGGAQVLHCIASLRVWVIFNTFICIQFNFILGCAWNIKLKEKKVEWRKWKMKWFCKFILCIYCKIL